MAELLSFHSSNIMIRDESGGAWLGVATMFLISPNQDFSRIWFVSLVRDLNDFLKQSSKMQLRKEVLVTLIIDRRVFAVPSPNPFPFLAIRYVV